MTTTQLVTRMLNESKEVQHSTGGLPAYRNVMNALEGKTLDFSAETGSEIGRFRKHYEIADMITKECALADIEACKNVYALEAIEKGIDLSV